MRTRPTRTLAVLAVAGLLAACGGGGSPGGGGGGAMSPEEYAAGLCGAASGWMSALVALNEEFQADLPATEGDPASLKDLMVAFLDGAVQDTETLLADVSALSPPDVDQGQEIHDGAISAFTQARDLFADSRDQVAALDPSDQEGFARALTDLGTTLEQAGTEIGGSIEGLSSPELDAAFNASPACDEVSAA